MDRSLRRDGQILVAVGAVLGALVGIVLGLGVEAPQASTAVAAQRPARTATPLEGQPTAAQPTGSGDQADSDASTGRQRTWSAYRPDQAQGRVHQDNKQKHKKDNEELRNHGKPGKDKDR